MSVIFLFFSLVFTIINSYKVYSGYAYYLTALLVSIYSVFIAAAIFGVLVSDFANFWSNNGILIYENYVALYSLFILFFYQFSIWFSEKTLGRYRLDYSSFFQKFEKLISKNKIFIMSIIIFIFTFIYLFIIDMNVVWMTREYLLIQSIDALKYKNPITILFQMLAPIIGLLSIIVICLSIRLKDKKSFILVLFPAILFYFMRVGDHSRFSVIYAAIFVVFFVISKNKFQKFILSPFFALMFFGNLLNSLYGRGQNKHGLSAVGDFFVNINSALSNNNGGALSNLFEGAFVHGESFKYIDHTYPLVFKILSLSPFPNFVDGYQLKASAFSLRLHEYVPMGATGEILIFGFPYFFFYFFVIFFAIRANMLALHKNKIILFIISLFLIILASYMQYTYPLRNIFRFFYLSIFLFYIPNFITRLKWSA